MTKQYFTIPEGCKAVTVEQVDNQIITTFEPEFKQGDVLVGKYIYGEFILVLNTYNDGNCHYFVAYFIFYANDNKNSLTFDNYMNNQKILTSLRYATPEESQRLWDALAKKCKRWNPETMQIEEIKKERWRAKKKERYYYVNSILYVVSETESGYNFDSIRHQLGNHFQTEEQAQRAADRLKAELDKFWEEELG